MKKKKEAQKPKEKEFSVSPFKALKGVTLDAGEQQAAKPGEPKAKPAPKPAEPKKGVPPATAKSAAGQPAKSREEMEDERLFLDAMAQVTRFTPTAAGPGKTQAKKQAQAQAAARTERDAEEEKVFLQAIETLKMDVRFADVLPEDDSPRPLPVNRLRQLRRGGIRIDFELDLHGLTRDEAIENLERFVRGAYNRGQKGVLVITGQGYNSPGEPVLKAAVARWLKEDGKAMVSEFVQAPQNMGGGGAVVVFLREKRAAEEPAKG